MQRNHLKRNATFRAPTVAVYPSVWHHDVHYHHGRCRGALDTARSAHMSLDIFDVSGQKVLLVGAGRGIGKGIALAFAQAGADVAVTGLTSTGVNRVAEEVRELGGTCLPLTGDATTAADTDTIVDRTIAEFGHIDTLINCVGDAIRKPVAQLPGSDIPGMTEAEWHSIVDINLTEAFQGCRAVGPHLLERGQGNVINISGWASFRGRPMSAAYDAAKGRPHAVHRVRGARSGRLSASAATPSPPEPFPTRSRCPRKPSPPVTPRLANPFPSPGSVASSRSATSPSISRPLPPPTSPAKPGPSTAA